MQGWIYFNPLAYIAFVILLPMNAKPVTVLMLGLLMGVFMDFFSGTAGLHTIVTLFTAYIRKFILMFTLGKESVEEGGMPSVKSLGAAKFMRYASLIAGIHCLLYFTVESLSWNYYFVVLLKTAVSGTVTLLSVWLVSLLFTSRTRKKA